MKPNSLKKTPRYRVTCAVAAVMRHAPDADDVSNRQRIMATLNPCTQVEIAGLNFSDPGREDE